MPERTLQARGLATRQRLLQAATEEFARYGIAGARVERIAEQADSNKAQLYKYFGSKEQLFDTIFEASLQQLLAVTPTGADDLAGWAVRLYDECLTNPDLIRLATWHRLERRPRGTLVENDVERFADSTRQGIAHAQKAGSLVKGSADDVLAIVIAMAMTWSPVSNVYAASADEGAAVHRERKALLRRVVTAAMTPQ